MKKIIFITGVMALIAGGYLLSTQEKKMSGDMQVSKAIKKEGKILSFPVEKAQITVPEISDFEEKYQDFSQEDLEKESQKLEKLISSDGLIDLANQNRLGIADQKKLLHYMRAKAVVSMMIFEIQSEQSEEL
jgi:hypothetical protein